MLTWQRLAEHLRQSTHAVIGSIRARRGERVYFLFAAALLSIGFGIQELPSNMKGFLQTWGDLGLIQGLFCIAGVGVLAYGGYRFWRLAHAPDWPPPKDRASAIKGPTAFGPEDGPLFRKLGRETDLQKLFGCIRDEKTCLIAVMGASGVGTTSLLRAGLRDMLLSQPDMKYHYWEAVPTEPGEGLLRALRETWETDMPPSSLDELVHPPSRLGSQHRVIVLDQLEQLRGGDPAACPIFGLLRAIARDAKPPHRITWIVAFRREFRADWSDFIIPEQERGFSPAELSLRPFTAERAREVLGLLAEEAGVSTAPHVVDNLLRAITVEGEVSAADIGIGLLLLSERGERGAGQADAISDYHFAGGPEGLTTQYVERCLERFPAVDREPLLRAMLALHDPETHQRIAEGLTAGEIALKVGDHAPLAKLQLERLTRSDIRLLETASAQGDSKERYRLPHDRLVPAVLRLCGKWLADVEQAKLKFSHAFVAWKNHGRRHRYLLDAKDLRLIERCQSHLSWGGHQSEKRDFLRRSMWQRTWNRLAWAAGICIFASSAWFTNLKFDRYESRRFLKESGYPPELYEWQHQLKTLTLSGPVDVERFTWLRSKSIEELNVKASAYSSSIAGLATLSRCASLKALGVDARYTQIADLKPIRDLKLLHQLTIGLTKTDVRDLAPIARLKSLTALTLDLAPGKVNDLEPLENLDALSELALDLRDSAAIELASVGSLKSLTHLRLELRADNVEFDLTGLGRLKALTELDLGLRNSHVTSLEPLEKLTSLSLLALDLGGSATSDLRPLENLAPLRKLSLDVSHTPIRDLKPLDGLTSLTELALDLEGSQVKDLKPLENLTSLTHLTLDLHNGQVSDLKPLARLKSLTQLTLDLRGSPVSDLKPLEELASLTELSLDLDTSQVKDLGPLARLTSLRRLALDLGRSQIRDLNVLEGLPNLSHLTLDLYGSPPRDLKPLGRAKALRQLALALGNSQITDLTPLGELESLTELSLRINPSRISDLTPLERLKSLTVLTLDVGSSKVSDLGPLARLDLLTHVSLDVRDSQVNHLKALEGLKSVTKLDLELDNEVHDLKPLENMHALEALTIGHATRAQRSSLQRIPRTLTHLVF